MFLWVLSLCLALYGLFTSSLGSRDVHLTKPLVPLIALSYDHQNHSKWHKWWHVRYNFPLFGDWWQHNQSKYKIYKKMTNWTTYTFLDAYHHPMIVWPPAKTMIPFVPPHIFYSSLICWLDSVGIFPLWNIIFLFGNISPLLLGTCLALIHISHFSPFGIKSPKRSCT